VNKKTILCLVVACSNTTYYYITGEIMERKSKVTQSTVKKKPDIKSLDGLTPDDAFTQTAQAESDKGQKAAKKTFSLQQRDIDYINGLNFLYLVFSLPHLSIYESRLLLSYFMKVIVYMLFMMHQYT
jgi:hypothetical protein